MSDELTHLDECGQQQDRQLLVSRAGLCGCLQIGVRQKGQTLVCFEGKTGTHVECKPDIEATKVGHEPGLVATEGVSSGIDEAPLCRSVLPSLYAQSRDNYSRGELPAWLARPWRRNRERHSREPRRWWRGLWHGRSAGCRLWPSPLGGCRTGWSECHLDCPNGQGTETRCLRSTLGTAPFCVSPLLPLPSLWRLWVRPRRRAKGRHRSCT